MRGVMVCVVAAFGWGSGGCGSGKGTADATMVADSAGDPDAAGCQPRTLLTGGTDIAPQGWTTVMRAPAQVTYGADYVHLQTSTTAGASTGGQLLLHDPGGLETGKPFKLQVVMLVEAVDPHNQFDSAAAIMGSFTPPFGTSNERDQMIYLDSGKVGWADGAQSFSVPVTDSAYHTYELSVDAGNVARLSVDGMSALMRPGFVGNGAIAIGDQTNEPNIDSGLRIRSVTKLCP